MEHFFKRAVTNRTVESPGFHRTAKRVTIYAVPTTFMNISLDIGYG